MIRKYSNNDKSKTIHLLKQNTPEYFAPSEEVDFEKYLGAVLTPTSIDWRPIESFMKEVYLPNYKL